MSYTTKSCQWYCSFQIVFLYCEFDVMVYFVSIITDDLRVMSAACTLTPARIIDNDSWISAIMRSYSTLGFVIGM